MTQRFIRRTLIGAYVLLPTGERGKVTGINTDTGIARVALDGGRIVDIDQDVLTMTR